MTRRLAVVASLLLLASGGVRAAGTVTLVADKLIEPFAIDFDADGNAVFVEMAGGERLRRVTKDGQVETLAGTGKKGPSAPQSAAAAVTFNGLHALAIDRAGVVYLADTFNHAISTYDPATKVVTRFAGTGRPGFAGDGGPCAAAQFTQTINIAFNAEQTLLYVADIGNRRVRVIDMKTKTIGTFAGTGTKGTPKDGAKASEQPLTDPRAVAVDAKGNVYVLERGGHRLYRVAPDGTITAVAGTGKSGKGGDGGPALKAAMNGPKFIAIDRDDSVLIVDTENHQVRRYTPGAETMSLVVGSGKAGGKFDADPLKLELKRPHGVTVHPKSGDIYVLERGGHRLYRVAPDGTITAVAGTGKSGKGGDGGPALKAAMNGPKFIAIDRDDSVLIVDTENHQVRRYTPGAETMSLVVGTGKAGGKFDADPLKVELKRPHGVTVHPKSGDIYVADSENGRVLKLSR